MERSESIKEIANALCKFQQEVGKIKKSANNPFFKSKYATLSDILDVIQEPLSNSGLSVMQLPVGENELETIVMHISGEFISSKYTMRPTKNDPQGVGSCITYQRRYALGAALSLNIDEDDDGNKASQKNDNAKMQKTNQSAPQTSSTSNLKKTFDLKWLNMPEFMKMMLDEEMKARKEGGRFSLRNFIDSKYRIDDNAFTVLTNAYIEYKTNNNIS